MDMEEKLKWLDENYLSDFERIRVDSEIRYQEPFSEMKEIIQEYSIASDENEEDNTYLSYNKVIGTSLDENFIWRSRSWIMHSCHGPGLPLRKRFLTRGSGKI